MGLQYFESAGVVKNEVQVQAQELCKKVGSLSEIVNKWLFENSVVTKNEVILCPGYDEEIKKLVVCAILKSGGVELGHAELQVSECEEQTSKIGLISESPGGNCQDLEFSVDQDAAQSFNEWSERRAKILGGVWNEELNSPVFPFDGVVAIALSYALTGKGEASLVRISKEDSVYEDCDPGLLPEELISCACYYSEPATGAGFGEVCYAAL